MTIRSLCRLAKPLLFAVIAMIVWSASAVHAFDRQDKLSRARALSHYMMGVMYDLNGLVGFAIQEYEEVLRYEDDVALPHLRLGANLARVGKLEQAESELNLASALNPNDLQARYLLALIYSTQREFSKAAAEYESILKSFSANDPQNVEIYLYLGQLYYSQRQYIKAMDQFEKILNIDGENTEIMYLLSSLYLEFDREDEAIDLLKECLAVDEGHAGCLNSLAYVYAENNIHLDEALILIQRALEQQPKNGAYLDTLAWVYYRQGMYVEALKKLKKADEYLDDFVIYDHIGDVYLAMDRAEEAKKYWRMALELLPEEYAVEQEAIIRKLNELQSHTVKIDVEEK